MAGRPLRRARAERQEPSDRDAVTYFELTPVVGKKNPKVRHNPKHLESFKVQNIVRINIMPKNGIQTVEKSFYIHPHGEIRDRKVREAADLIACHATLEDIKSFMFSRATDKTSSIQEWLEIILTPGTVELVVWA